jgi:hypothetical protein
MDIFNSQPARRVPVAEDDPGIQKEIPMSLKFEAVQDVVLTDSGVWGYRSKPFDPLILHRQILNILAGKAKAGAP